MVGRIPENVIIVLRASNKSTDEHLQGYIVDPTSRSQLESARSWAAGTGFDSVTKTSYGLDPVEIYTENNNFKLTFLDSAGQSSQGGKLSFWNCLIEKEPDIHAIVGIEQSWLLQMIKQSHIDMGTVREGLSLVKGVGTAGVVHNKMQEWSELNKTKTTDKKPKTTKWKLGTSYVTDSGQSEDMYICDMYKTYTEEHTSRPKDTPTSQIFKYKSYVSETHLTFGVKPVKKLIIGQISTYRAMGIITSGEITNLLKFWDASYERALNIKTVGDYSEDMSYIFPQFSWCGKEIDKFSSRAMGRYQIEVPSAEEIQNKVSEILRVYREKVLDTLRSGRVVPYDKLLIAFGYMGKPDDKIEFTDEIKQLILKSVHPTVIIDFGDGVRHSGKLTH